MIRRAPTGKVGGLHHTETDRRVDVVHSHGDQKAETLSLRGFFLHPF
jgi:hypothetical protein